ncbi:MAG: phosphoglucomutase/phosphomannomutase family protein [Chloroflexi bacterium]|nr:phosphoglucomutase/phosphomannomutase family protein [Chloroflexota bacterium]
MSNVIKFGTEGWRGIIAEDFTFDNVRACSEGLACYMEEAGLASRGLVIGYDTRFASEHFAAAVAEVAAGHGIRSYLGVKPLPTPLLSFAVKRWGAGAAVIITASHNPAPWNGFKIKTGDGVSASPEIIGRIEGLIERVQHRGRVARMPLDSARADGLVSDLDPEPQYFEQVGKLVDLAALRRAGLKVVVDSMYATASGYLRRLLEGGSTSVVEIHAERNPIFPGMRNPEPIDINLGELCRTVVEAGGSVGVATDGDADRLGVVDENGRYVTTLQVLPLLALYLLEVRGERGAIVRSHTTSNMLARLGERFGVPVFETPVGFKYVGNRMLEVDALLGGEESGGYAFRGHVPERDGILSALYFLDLLVRRSQTPSQCLDYLYSLVGPHHYQRSDFTFPAEQRDQIWERMQEAAPDLVDGTPVAQRHVNDGYRFVLADGSWLMVRFSGTEPLVRIYAESSTPVRAAQLVDAGRRLAGL